MDIFAISLASVIAIFIAYLSVSSYIRRKYREFCRKEDQKERIGILRAKIGSARTFLAESFSSPENRYIQDDILPKINFIEKLILHKDPSRQEKELQNLIDMLTETFLRLQQDFYNIPFILSPLNTLRDRLVREHLDWLKDHMDDGDFLDENL